jgi:hypothetical protein
MASQTISLQALQLHFGVESRGPEQKHFGRREHILDQQQGTLLQYQDRV